MRSTYALSALAVATSVYGQLTLPSSLFGLTFSPACQQAILSVASNASFAACVPVNDLLPSTSFSLVVSDPADRSVLSNGSIITALDTFMSAVCYSEPCSNDTLSAASATIIQSCGADLMNESLSDSVVTQAFAAYPIVREVLCLKTATPYTNTSYGGVLGNPPVSISSGVYNSTGGYFCVTSLLTQLSAYFGVTPTLPFIEGAVAGTNVTALGLAESTQTNILCNPCIFAAIDIVEEVYPSAGMVPVSYLASYVGATAPNVTVNTFVNSTCAYDGLAATTNGTLPANVSVSIINSTFPYTLTNGTATFAPGV